MFACGSGTNTAVGIRWTGPKCVPSVNAFCKENVVSRFNARDVFAHKVQKRYFKKVEGGRKRQFFLFTRVKE